MPSAPQYPKRIIEVDLPIKRISAHARREKSIRQGHISTLHIWWARRPLAACRAVICGALWPDPADTLCPETFRLVATTQLRFLSSRFMTTKHGADELVADLRSDLGSTKATKRKSAEAERDRRIKAWGAFKQKAAWTPLDLRAGLLEFIGWSAGWEQSTMPTMFEAARALTQAAHEALGGGPGTRPLVVDPFAGGGSIPFEALRLGADAYASDLNPIPVLLNKVALEYIPKYGPRLADQVRIWAESIMRIAEAELADFYPKDDDGATPIAYLWARTIRCEGPGCGTEVPLMRSLWLARKAKRSVALQIISDHGAKSLDFRIIVKQRDGWVDQANADIKIKNPTFAGTVKRGSATCPCCNYTTPVARVREQLKLRHGGTRDARMIALVTASGQQDRQYRLANQRDVRAAKAAETLLEIRKNEEHFHLGFVPNESTASYHSFVNRGPIYGMTTWEDYYTPRQALVLGTLTKLVRELPPETVSPFDQEFANAVKTILGLGVSKLADICNSFCMWETSKTQVRHLFTKQAIPMMWDFAETCAFSEAAGTFTVTVGNMAKFLEGQRPDTTPGQSTQASACSHPLPTDSAAAMITDPPYYYSVQYADASDFFYVWLRRALSFVHPDLFLDTETPKDEEIVVQSPGHQFAAEGKNNAHYESHMRKAMAEGRRVVAPDGLGVVVFAHTSTTGWESQLQAMTDAGWIITGSWPIDTELANRLISVGRSVLASSVHLVCRPRENPDGSVRTDAIGDWRDVLQELPRRIHEWMPRLAAEGVVGADAIFACLGPALEIFSRYERVEKASGEAVTLRDFLEQVWAAVAREALATVLRDGDAGSLEPDARLTVIWLWTLAGRETDDPPSDLDGSSDENDDPGSTDSGRGGLVLEFDTARKIAQGLGAKLEQLVHTIEVRGDKARLLPVSERAAFLFGKESALRAKSGRKNKQLALFAELEDAVEAQGREEIVVASKPGATTLDRIHQAMLLFESGRAEALKRFLVDEGGADQTQFWRLAQSLSALYPGSTDEKRWIDGVLARKKGLGLG